jgi:hypothetical protein
MTEDCIIAEIAKRHGVLLDRHDPILLVSTMLDMHAADQQERDERIVSALSEANRPPPPVLTDDQVQAIAKRTAQGAAAWAADTIKAAHRQHYVIMLATILAAVALGGVSTWWAFGLPMVAAPARVAIGLGVMLLSGVVGYGIATTTLRETRGR